MIEVEMMTFHICHDLKDDDDNEMIIMIMMTMIMAMMMMQMMMIMTMIMTIIMTIIMTMIIMIKTSYNTCLQIDDWVCSKSLKPNTRKNINAPGGCLGRCCLND